MYCPYGRFRFCLHRLHVVAGHQVCALLHMSNWDKSLLEVCARPIFTPPDFCALNNNLNCCSALVDHCVCSVGQCVLPTRCITVSPPHLFPSFYNRLHWILGFDQPKQLCLFVTFLFTHPNPEEAKISLEQGKKGKSKVAILSMKFCLPSFLVHTPRKSIKTMKT